MNVVFKRTKRIIKKIINRIEADILFMRWLFERRSKKEAPVAFLFHFSKWKHSFIPNFLTGYTIKFIPSSGGVLLPYLLRLYKNKVFIVWGYAEQKKLVEYADKYNIPVYRMEDGFIRSIGLGSMFSEPISMCLDKQELYYNSKKPSDLEDMLNTYDFSKDVELLERAGLCMTRLNQLGLSKYNHVKSQNIQEIYGPKNRKRILVIGQVEDDASIKMGCERSITNNDLVRLASKENPDAEIIYKPHPDVLFGRRDALSNPAHVQDIATVITTPLSLSDAFQTIDHVYTITSLAGFEALMRGIKVTCIGAPFYSGWGLTDDRQPVPRRKQQRTLAEVFAAAYILYPVYVNPVDRSRIEVEEAIDLLYKQKNMQLMG